MGQLQNCSGENERTNLLEAPLRKKVDIIFRDIISSLRLSFIILRIAHTILNKNSQWVLEIDTDYLDS